MKLRLSRLFWLGVLMLMTTTTVIAADPSGNPSTSSTSPTTSPTDPNPSITPTNSPTSPSSSPSTPVSVTTSTTPPHTEPSPTDSPTNSHTSPNPPPPSPTPSDPNNNPPPGQSSSSQTQGGNTSPSSQSVSGTSALLSSSGFISSAIPSFSSGMTLSMTPSKASSAANPSSTNIFCIADASGANNTCTAPDQYCDTTTSLCLAKLENGASCSADNQCTSGVCQNQICAVAASTGPNVGVVVGGVIGGIVALVLIVFLVRKCFTSNNGFDDDNEYEHEVRAHTPSEFNGHESSRGSLFGALAFRRTSDPSVQQKKRRGRGITPSMIIEASPSEMQEMSNFSNIGKGAHATTVDAPSGAYVPPVTSHHDRQMSHHRPAQTTGPENWQQFQQSTVDAPNKRRSVYNVLSGALAQMRTSQVSPLLEEEEDKQHLAPTKINDVYRSSVESSRQKELQSQQEFLQKFVNPKAAASWPVAEILAEPNAKRGESDKPDSQHARHSSNVQAESVHSRHLSNVSTTANFKHQSTNSLGGKSRASSLYPSIGDYHDEDMLPEVHQSVLEAVMSEQEMEEPLPLNAHTASRQSTDSEIINDKSKYHSNNPFADSALQKRDSDAASVGTSIAAQRQLRQLRERETVETLAPETSKRQLSRYSTNSDYSEYEASSVRSSVALDEELDRRASLFGKHASESSKYESGLPAEVSANVATAMTAAPADAQKVVVTSTDSEVTIRPSGSEVLPAALQPQPTSSLRVPTSVASNTRQDELANLEANLRNITQDLGFRLSSVSMDENPGLKKTLEGASNSSFKRLSTSINGDEVVDWDGLFRD